MENWKWIPNYSGMYQVSDMGRVKSFRRYKDGIYLRPGTMNRFGHCSVTRGRKNSQCVHTLVLITFIGPRPLGKEALHQNGIGGDNRLTNLRWGTRAENNIDSAKLGRRKLNPEKVKYIRLKDAELFGIQRRYLVERLATKFQVSKGLIYAVWSRKVWSHV